MDELVRKLIERAKLDETKANEVVGIVRDFLGEKLPPNILKQINGFLENEKLDKAKDVFGKAKGLFSK